MKIFKIGLINLLLAITVIVFSGNAFAQNINEVRWKSEAQVRTVLGEPNSMSSPIGTHASYTLWQYDDFTVAFSNNRAFHLFNKNSLKRMDLNEKRPN